METCPRCGATPSPGDRFCRECGGYLSTAPSFDDLEPPGSAPAGEEPPGYGMGDAIQFSGPAIPAIDDGPEPVTQSWFSGATEPTWTAEPQYEQPQYEQPQYDAPRYDQQYAAPAYGQQQYEAPPIDRGGPVPFDDHPGYEVPDYPGGSSDRRRRGGLLVGLAVLVVILLVTIGAVVVFGNRGDDTAEPGGGSSSVATSGSSPSGSAGAPADTPEGQAEAVDELLSRAAGGKSLLTTAYDQANSCEISPSSAEQKFEDAAQNRRDIVADARELDTSKLDDGPRIRSLMISMYNTSAKADDAFAEWARAGAESGATCLEENAKRTKGNNLSIKAGKAKRQFVKVWNPVAEQYGHTKRTKDGL